MAGRILICDAVATNRIVLRCKLTAAYYDVVQASVMENVAKLAQEAMPDAMILDADRGWKESLDAARGVGGELPCPVILLTQAIAPADRAAAIRAGATAVLNRPVDENLLLAALRRSMRESCADAELLGRAGLSSTFQLAEPAAEFRQLEPVNLIAFGSPRLHTLHRPLERAMRQPVRCPGMGDASAPTELAGRTFVVITEMEKRTRALRLVSEIRSRPGTRDAAILLVVTGEGTNTDEGIDLLTTALDVGADDVQIGEDIEEMAARLETQLKRRRRQEALKNSISAGLRLAARDPLTGLYNRRVAMPQLAEMLRQAKDTGRALTVMIADLDHFKQINDTFGHASGDRVLVEVARRLRAAVTEDDMVARIGGEEFLIALPNASIEAGSVAAGRIHAALRDLPVRDPSVSGGIPVTASIGIASYAPKSDDQPPQVNDLLEIADQALLRAKSDGRDQIMVARSAA